MSQSLSERHPGDRRRRQGKSENAFRTISEVADELSLASHVLRFWETKFTQIKPMKRGGGRRYYRPEDVALLRQIRTLLYDKGYTIKGVQKLMREGSSAPSEMGTKQASGTQSPLSGESAQLDHSAGNSPRHNDIYRDALRSLLDDLEGLRELL